MKSTLIARGSSGKQVLLLLGYLILNISDVDHAKIYWVC